MSATEHAHRIQRIRRPSDQRWFGRDFTTSHEVLAMGSTTPARIVGLTPGTGDAVLPDGESVVISTTIDDAAVYRRSA